MEPLVELITAWQKFIDQHANISVESFCHNYLSQIKKHQQVTEKADIELAKLIGKVNSLHKTYLKLAFMGTVDIEPEWFYILETVYQYKEIRKTDVIGLRLLLEPTTGIDILNRMLKAGLISERIDTTDKRARLLKLTSKGSDLLKKSNALVGKVSSLLFKGIDPDHKALISLALSKLVNDQYLSIAKNKNKATDDVKALMNSGSKRS